MLRFYFRDGGLLNFYETPLSKMNKEDVLRRLLNLLGRIGRFANRLETSEQSVLSHSWDAANVAAILGYDKKVQAYMALHDLQESVMGDLPTPIKREIGKVAKEIEEQIYDRLIGFMEIQNPSYYEPTAAESVASIQEAIDKALVVMEATVYMPQPMADALIKTYEHLDISPQMWLATMSSHLAKDRPTPDQMIENIVSLVKEAFWTD